MITKKDSALQLKKTIAQQAAALKEAKAQADALFESIGDGVITTDSNGRINKINKAAQRMLGFSEKEVIGAWFPKQIKAYTLDHKLVETIDRPISLSFLSQRPVTAKLLYEKKDGTTFPISVTVSPILLGDEPVGAVETFRDITADLQINDMKDDFISIASHELRTPATIVKQYISMLAEGFAGKITKKQKQMLNQAYESNERQIKIVDDLLKVARLDGGEFKLNKKNTDLIKLIQGVVKEQRPKIIAAEGEVNVIVSTSSAVACVDPTQIKMVVTNLIDNALKYSPEKPKITIRTTQSSEVATIKVSDNGVGISQEDMQKLFQKFSRLYNSETEVASGSGLGLYWVKQIVDMHNGDIKVTSKPGIGSQFCVTVPLK